MSSLLLVVASLSTALAYVPAVQLPHVRNINCRGSHVVAKEDSPFERWQTPVDALAAAMTQAEAVTEGLAAAAKELDDFEAATAEELGLSLSELETFMDGEDGDAPDISSPVQAMADLQVAQEDASAALADGFAELESIEKDLAEELGITVEELEVVEDSKLADYVPPEGYEWGGEF